MAPVAIVVPVKNGNYIPDSFLTFVFIMTWALAQIESFRQKKAVTEQTVHPNKNDKMQTNPLFVSTQNQNAVRKINIIAKTDIYIVALRYSDIKLSLILSTIL